jgi:hypothetical protein
VTELFGFGLALLGLRLVLGYLTRPLRPYARKFFDWTFPSEFQKKFERVIDQQKPFFHRKGWKRLLAQLAFFALFLVAFWTGHNFVKQASEPEGFYFSSPRYFLVEVWDDGDAETAWAFSTIAACLNFKAQQEKRGTVHLRCLAARPAFDQLWRERVFASTDSDSDNE